MKKCWERDCAIPLDEHACFAEGVEHACYGRLTHQHIPRRSRGGHEVVAILDWPVHDACDNGIRIYFAGKKRRIQNDVVECAVEGTRHYRIYDRDTKETLLVRDIS